MVLNGSLAVLAQSVLSMVASCDAVLAQRQRRGASGSLFRGCHARECPCAAQDGQETRDQDETGAEVLEQRRFPVVKEEVMVGVCSGAVPPCPHCTQRPLQAVFGQRIHCCVDCSENGVHYSMYVHPNAAPRRWEWSVQACRPCSDPTTHEVLCRLLPREEIGE